MKAIIAKTGLVLKLTLLISSAFSYAETFEIVDGSAQVAGSPNVSQAKARRSWEGACEKWKAETRELNRGDKIMMMSCETPVCDSDFGMVVCSSEAVFKVRVSGTSAAQIARESVRDQVDVGTAAMMGLIFMGAASSWNNHHSHWHSNHWGHHYDSHSHWHSGHHH